MHFQNVAVYNVYQAMRGMRNPMMSHAKTDTTSTAGMYWTFSSPYGESKFPVAKIGPDDHRLAMSLIGGGSPHRKFLRQILVSADICKMPSYLLHEFATYKVGTTLDCSSTMHKITSRDLAADDFEPTETTDEQIFLGDAIHSLNHFRRRYLIEKNLGNDAEAEKWFRALKRNLPGGYLYERMTWTANYEVLAEIHRWRRNHRLPAWHQFCENFIERLPYAEFITGGEE